jgi:prevent-host-death family protein
MEEILISEFKAKCIAILKRVQMTRRPVIVTRRGKPIARIEPIQQEVPRRKLGTLRKRLTILGNIVSEDTSRDWEMLDETTA